MLWITGNLTIGGAAQILLSGLTPGDVVILVNGTVAWGTAAMVEGTLLVSNSPCLAGGSSSIKGAIICDGKVTLGGNFRLTFKPASNVSLP